MNELKQVKKLELLQIKAEFCLDRNEARKILKKAAKIRQKLQKIRRCVS